MFLVGVDVVKRGEPYTAESVQMLCLNCPLPDCNEESRNCLIQIARRRDARLNRAIIYNDMLADPEYAERRKEQKRVAARRYYERHKKAA